MFWAWSTILAQPKCYLSLTLVIVFVCTNAFQILISLSLSLFCSLLASCSHTKLHPSLALCCVELGSIHLSLLHSIYRQKSTVGFFSLSLSNQLCSSVSVETTPFADLMFVWEFLCRGTRVYCYCALLISRNFGSIWLWYS